jgi:regulator of telomere elongation helicase 1
LVSACLKKAKSIDPEESCRYFKSTHEDTSEQFNGYSNHDIESLKEEGRNSKFCPYFHSRRSKDIADVLFMPYNYLINQNNFQVFNIELQNCVLIFDEGHNILSVSEEGASISISVE